MMYSKKLLQLVLLPVLLLACTQRLYSQSSRDTTTWIHDFRQAFAFAGRPEVYVSTATTLSSAPVLESDDTLHLAGRLYQAPGYYYNSDGREEVLWQGGLLVRVNHTQQTLLLRKVDSAVWARAARPWKGQKQFEAALSNGYRITRRADGDGVQYELQAVRTIPGVPGIVIHLSCDARGLPQQLSMEASLTVEATDEMLAQVDAAGYARSNLLSTEGSRSVIRRSQTLMIMFETIAFERSQNLKLPQLASFVAYDAASDSYTGAGSCAGYSVTQTF